MDILVCHRPSIHANPTNLTISSSLSTPSGKLSAITFATSPQIPRNAPLTMSYCVLGSSTTLSSNPGNCALNSRYNLLVLNGSQSRS